MKRIFVLALAILVCAAGFGQDKDVDMSKYLAQDAVVMKDGKVVFSDAVKLVQGCSYQQARTIAMAWLGKYLAQGNKGRNRVVTDEGEKVVAVAQKELVFQKSAFAYDKADMEYVLTLYIKDGECVLDMERIKYNYNDGTGNETILAEDYITYAEAVNKKGTKLLPITGKFRRKTIDAAQEAFASFREGMRYCSVEGVAELSKVVPQIAAAVPQAAAPQQAAPQQAVAPAVAVQQPQQVYQPQQTSAASENQSSGMEGYRKIAPDKIPGNVMKMISQDWMLITAGNREKFNMMTASWGGFGILYNKPVAICFINPARYTYSIIEGSDTFTLTFYTEAYRDALQYCGTKSGRDEDKVKGSGLTPMETQSGAMAFSQAWMVVECRKMLSQSLSPDAIADPAERAKRAAQPMHKMYIGEILNVWVK